MPALLWVNRIQGNLRVECYERAFINTKPLQLEEFAKVGVTTFGAGPHAITMDDIRIRHYTRLIFVTGTETALRHRLKALGSCSGLGRPQILRHVFDHHLRVSCETLEA